MGSLSLMLLGPFSATLGTEPLGSFRTRLAQALLIYLACQPERHKREDVMALLWPDLSQASAQQNLRQNLYFLRQTIAEVESRDGKLQIPLILADRDFLQLNPDANVQVDARRLDVLLHLPRPDSAQMKEAVNLYRGDFLADFYLPNSSPFEEWVRQRREYYRRAILDYLEKLTFLALDVDNFQEAESYARHQLHIDPLREISNRQLIETLARSGQRSAALGHYDNYRRLLEEDLQVPPGSETLALVHQIRSGTLETSHPKPGKIRGYEIIEELGHGSYSTVYRALHTAVGREVAIKVIASRYADDVDFIRRFEAEAQIVARLEHPHVIPLYDFWREPGNAYLVMRYLRGGSLKSALTEGGWPLARVAALLDQIADALHAAHTLGIVHRDVKPDNIMLDELGRAYLTDFGIAQAYQSSAGDQPPELFAGTPDYISPEQAQFKPLSSLSDQYSLGLVIFEALTGQVPFKSPSILELFQMHLKDPLPSIHEWRPDIPLVIEQVLRQAVAKEPADRYPDVIAFASAFRQAANLKPISNHHADRSSRAINPYKGLIAFSEADELTFYGRETITHHLLGRMAEEGNDRFLAIVGPSGSGKSSLVSAGLVPAFRRGALPGSEKWFIVNVVLGTHPLEDLEAALLRIAVDPPESIMDALVADEQGLAWAAKSILPQDGNSELVLIFDQFEDLFIRGANSADIAFFINSLCAAVNDPNGCIRIVLTLRADYYDRPLLHPCLSELMQQRTEVVVPLSADELARSIIRPAAHSGIDVEPELVAALITDVNEQPGALPLLQYALRELFENRSGSLMTLAAYKTIGGISGALSRRADSIYDEQDPVGQRLARALFTRLVSIDDELNVNRRRVLVSELMSISLDEVGKVDPNQDNPSFLTEEPAFIDSGQSPAVIGDIIDRFGRAYLLSFDHDPATRGSTVEIAHESLMKAWPRLANWLETNRNEFRLRRLLTEATKEWVASGADDGFLLRGARLNQLLPLLQADVVLTASERRLLENSRLARNARITAEDARRQQELSTARALAENEQRRAEEQTISATRLRRRAALLSAALAIAGIAAILAFGFGRSSARNAQLAATREAEAIANASLAATRETEAVNSANLATSRELSSAATNAISIDPELSILLALQALEKSSTKEAEEALHQALQHTRVLSSFNSDATGRYGSLFALSPDGKRIATADRSTVMIWDPMSGTLVQEIPISPSVKDHYELDFNESGDGVALISTIEEGDLVAFQSWDLAESASVTYNLTTLPADESTVISLHPDWSLMAMLREDSLVDLWDMASNHSIITLAGHDDIIVDVTFDPTGNLLATAARNGQVFIWDLASLRSQTDNSPAYTIQGDVSNNDSGGLVHISFIADRGLILGYLGQIEVWDLEDVSRPKFTLVENSELTLGFSVSQDLKRLATAGQDGTTQIWDLNTAEHILTLAQHPSPVTTVAFGPTPGTLFTLDRNGLLRMWDSRPHALGEKVTFTVDRGVFDIELRPGGHTMALGNAGGPASTWDLTTGERLHIFPGDVGGVYRVDYSPDGSLLAAVGTDNQIRIYESDTGNLVSAWSGHGAGVTSGLFPGTLDIQFSPDGARIATAGADGIAKVWDVASGLELVSFEEHTDSLHSLAWSSDGRFLVTTSDENDTSVIVWNPETGEQIHTLEGHPVRAWGLAFTPDDKKLITGGARGIIKAWDVSTGQNLYTVIDESDHIGSVAMSPDGEFFVTTGEVPLRIRRTIDGQELLTLADPLLWSAAISDDGRWIYAADVDGIVRVFAVHLEDAITLAHERLTRWWRLEECRRYLHTDECPPAPEIIEANGRT